MNADSFGQLILKGGGSRAPSRDVDDAAEVALFLASGRGLLNPPDLSKRDS